MSGQYPASPDASHPSESWNREPPLPPVQPPSAGFLLQLFLIPLVIVSIIVVVWLLFSWLAHLGSDPQSLVTDMKRLNQASWQKAMTLADLLRNPEHDALKDDPRLASELAQVLDEQLEAGRLDRNSVKMRMFLCRALGEFRVPEVIPVLCKAATTDRDGGQLDGIEINVRLSALEAIALLVKSLGSETARQHEEIPAVLLAAAAERDERDAWKRSQNQQLEEPTDRLDLRTPHSEIRAVAAFALGVLGTPEALDKLHQMTRSDPYPNARYNAATGLARQGDVRALPVLSEMLDPENETVVEGETDSTEQEWKRLLVLTNAVRAARQLIEENPGADLQPLQVSLERLIASRPQRGVLVEAQEARQLLQQRNP